MNTSIGSTSAHYKLDHKPTNIEYFLFICKLVYWF